MAEEHPSESNGRSNRSDELELEPWYKDGNDDIVEPHRVTLQTQYFWKHWVRILGVGPAALLIRLRMYCYNNPETGERRDYCHPGQKTLGRELGVHRETIMAWIRRLQTFDFIRRKAQSRWSPEHGHQVRTTDRFLVKMWDPSVPEHAGAAFVGDAQRLSNQASETLEQPNDPEKSEKSTFHPEPVDNQSEMSKTPTFQAVEKPDSRRSTLKEYIERNVGFAHTGTHEQNAGPTSVADVLPRALHRRQPPKQKHLADVLPNIRTSAEQRDRLLKVEDLADQMASQLGDIDSLVFYRKVARRFLDAGKEHLVYRALSDVKEGERDGTLRKVPAVFTTRIQELAIMNDIEL
jgi:hypothetical protein